MPASCAARHAVLLAASNSGGWGAAHWRLGAAQLCGSGGGSGALVRGLAPGLSTAHQQTRPAYHSLGARVLALVYPPHGLGSFGSASTSGSGAGVRAAALLRPLTSSTARHLATSSTLLGRKAAPAAVPARRQRTVTGQFVSWEVFRGKPKAKGVHFTARASNAAAMAVFAPELRAYLKEDRARRRKVSMNRGVDVTVVSAHTGAALPHRFRAVWEPLVPGATGRKVSLREEGLGGQAAEDVSPWLAARTASCATAVQLFGDCP